MFHVEHTPIEKLPANLRRPFEQAEAVGVDQLQRQDLGQLRSATGVLPVDADLELTLTVTGDPQRAVTTLGQLDLTEDGAGELFVLNDRQQPRATKRTGKPQQVNGFQNTGFAAAVGAVKNVDAGGGGEGHRVQIAHRGDRNTT